MFEPGEIVRVEPTLGQLRRDRRPGDGTVHALPRRRELLRHPRRGRRLRHDPHAGHGELRGYGGLLHAVRAPPGAPRSSTGTRPWTRSSDPPGEKTWTIHIGDSFTDVPGRTSSTRSSRTSFTTAITAGCGGDQLLPRTNTTPRKQMAVFLLKSLDGPGLHPARGRRGIFDDVPDGRVPAVDRGSLQPGRSPEGAAADRSRRRSRTVPTPPVKRKQMAVFLLKTLLGIRATRRPPATGSSTTSSTTGSGPGSRTCTTGRSREAALGRPASRSDLLLSGEPRDARPDVGVPGPDLRAGPVRALEVPRRDLGWPLIGLGAGTASVLLLVAPRLLMKRAQDRLARRLLAEEGGRYKLLTRAELVTGAHRRIPGVLGLTEDAVEFRGLFGENDRSADCPHPEDRDRAAAGERPSAPAARDPAIYPPRRRGGRAGPRRASASAWRSHLGLWAIGERKAAMDVVAPGRK